MQKQVVLAAADDETTAVSTGVSVGPFGNIKRSAHMIVQLLMVRAWKQSLARVILMLTACCFGNIALWARCLTCPPPPVLSALTDTIYNTPRIFYLGGDRHVHQYYLDGVWKADDPTMDAGATLADPSSALATLLDPANNGPEVFYVGTDQHVHILRYDNGSWLTADVSGDGGGPPAAPGTALTALFDSINQTPDVFYLGTDQHVHILYFDGQWHPGDVTMDAGAPPAAQGTGLSSFFTANPMNGSAPVNVFYLTTDGHAHDLVFADANGWASYDVTFNGQAPPAVGNALNSPIYPDANVLYFGADVGADKHLLEVNGAFFFFTDWTGTTGAPPPDLLSAFTSVTDPNVAQAPWGIEDGVYRFYVAKGHVYVLYVSYDNHNRSIDLNVGTGAAQVVPGSSLTALFDPIDGAVKVFYSGTDGHIWLLSGSINGNGDGVWSTTRL